MKNRWFSGLVWSLLVSMTIYQDGLFVREPATAENHLLDIYKKNLTALEHIDMSEMHIQAFPVPDRTIR